MYYYFFDRYYGHDRIAQAYVADTVAWDFFEAVGYGYVLCLWESLSRVEQYTKYIEPKLQDTEIIMIQKCLLSEQSLQMLHRFTHHRFCAYKKAIPLYLANPEEIAKRRLAKKVKKSDTPSQSLIIYPNVWSLQNDKNIDIENEWFLLLHSQSTKKQKAEIFWWLRNGKKNALVCTYSQMFQDWMHLTDITLVDQHTWYYKSPQDPRYEAGAVVDKLWEIYGCKVKKTWYVLELV